MFRRNYLLNLCGVILVAISFGVLLSSDEANAQNAIATLANGNYQLCSQPKPSDWRNGAGVCFNFTKTGDRVDGYYGYPHSDDFICVRGLTNGSLITGEALAISWGGRQWISIPKTEFKWDEEGHLSLKDGKVIRTAMDRGGRTEWILFSHAKLNTDGFYQYPQPFMTSPSQLCDWQ
ncbi:hypothetical protein PseudUWO311_19225 [Pseudanabaena sp. UWO311]|uniref:hypothetical protein n=1 Tax=Pseudanabaena sp. UWO311 TaxID=2487337 RepID=UPI001157F489|nr:hypothetical protein [Pseudanabaena sp. UWO311]TYQ24436.1 hypothetical protein PseudUWO311_19225 [Pseudanabaena sp. UWO311]